MVNQPATSMQDLARWLLDFEASAADPAGEKPQEVFSVCGKLRRGMSTLVGTAGFRSLLRRSLTLAQANVPWLEAVRVGEDGSWELPHGEWPQDKDEVAKGEAALVAQLLELLAAFIGESLTLVLVREIWTGAPYMGRDVGTEEDA